MSWLTDFLRGQAMRTFISLSKRIIKLLLGRVWDRAYNIAKEEIEAAEASGLSGKEKFQMALDGIKERLRSHEIPNSVLNLLIELVVNELDPKF